MITQNLVLAVRNMKKRKLYSFINVFGLSIGVAVCLVILKYVDFELSYDRHHEHGPHIYRTILTRYTNGEFRDVIGLTGYGTGPALKADLPGIKQVARTHAMYGGAVLSVADRPVQFLEERAYLVDPSFLQIFTFKVLSGNLSTALDGPNDIVITRSLADKYFGRTDVLGQTLKVTGAWMDHDFTVTAVINDQPENSSLVFDFLLPLNDLLKDQQYAEDDGWGWKNFTTYIEVYPGTNMDDLVEKMPGFLSKYINGKQDITFQPLYNIHTQTGFAFDSSDRVPRNKIYFFVLIALFILCIAWINYINLATARAMERAREVGIKKVIGAQKRQLVFQFILESAIINFFAVGVALILAVGLLPVLGGIVGKDLSFDFSDARLWLFLSALAACGSFMAGIYPAFVLSSFKVTAVLKGGPERLSGTFPLRKALVVFQFACSLVLISLTVVIYRQIAFMERQVSGLNMEQILIVKAPYVIERETAEQRLLTFKHELQNLSSVKSVCTSAGVPGGGYTFTTTMRKEGDPSDAQKSGNVIWVDRDVIETYNIEMLSGRVWESDAGPDLKSLIVNETALSTFEIDDDHEALNHRIIFENDTFSIAGVMKDFHWNSLKTANVPIIFSPQRIVRHTFSMRLSTEEYNESVRTIESLFKRLFPGNPVEYYFLDDYFNQHYKQEQNFGKMFTGFALFAIVISCLGLFGLTSFTTDKKQKEISIRKVLGASTGSLMSLLSRDFLTLVLLATVCSFPIMWYASTSWLASFAFRMDLTWDIFVGPVLALTVLCLVTVGTNIIRGARVDPAKVLKDR